MIAKLWTRLPLWGKALLVLAILAILGLIGYFILKFIVLIVILVGIGIWAYFRYKPSPEPVDHDGAGDHPKKIIEWRQRSETEPEYRWMNRRHVMEVTSKELSATALAKELKKSPHDVHQHLSTMGLIIRTGNTWQLTPAGQSKGGSYREHAKYGRYIVWPESLLAELDDVDEDLRQNPQTATSLGKAFAISSTRMNLILSELGWITRTNDIKGWQITESGKSLLGIQSKHKESGRPYVRWPDTIVNNTILISSIRESKGEVSTHQGDKPDNAGQDELQFREKFPAQLRAKDGHYVRSKAELIIDNFLYEAEIAHAYERQLPVKEETYCDFYIQKAGKKVYIEYWGYESDSKYLLRKQKKIETYKKHDYQLIELTDKDVSSLDDVFPRKLREKGIEIE